MREPRLSVRAALGFAAFAVLALACRQDMHDQPRVKPLGANDFFVDGQGARPLPAHAVARGDLRADVLTYTGMTPEGDLATAPPMPVTRELLTRGRERFDIFCSPCHGRAGEGRGMVVQRGYKQPTSYHDPRLVGAPTDYFVQVITQGFGVMPSYASQVSLEDRWAIAYYIRALQYSQNARLADLPADQRAKVESALARENR